MEASFELDWEKWHSGRQPIGWRLLTDDTLPWLRLHSLPNSKRYADNNSERETILGRANAIGDHLLGTGSDCWTVQSRADGIGGQGEYAGEFAEDEEPGSTVWRFFAQRVIWKAGTFDNELLEIAADGPFYQIWMNRDTGAVFAPYDGGFDLFPADWRQVDMLKAQWSTWLSDHPSGL